jgi:MarR family transcriptional regulator, transcriptional regulator for hemolysin
MSSPNGVTHQAAGSGLGHELDAPPWLRVESTLMATANAIRSAYDVRLADLGLTLSLASLVAYVADYGPVNQTRVAEHLGQGRAVTGTQIDRLETLGFVERLPDSNDRRVWLVAITDSGLSLAESIGAVDRVLRAELRTGISRADRQTLAATLVRLQQNLHRSVHESTNPSNRESLHDSHQQGAATP